MRIAEPSKVKVCLVFRQEAIKHAERERHKKYKKQEEEREVIRQAMRDKVSHVHSSSGRP